MTVIEKTILKQILLHEQEQLRKELKKDYPEIIKNLILEKIEKLNQEIANL